MAQDQWSAGRSLAAQPAGAARRYSQSPIARIGRRQRSTARRSSTQETAPASGWQKHLERVVRCSLRCSYLSEWASMFARKRRTLPGDYLPHLGRRRRKMRCFDPALDTLQRTFRSCRALSRKRCANCGSLIEPIRLRTPVLRQPRQGRAARPALSRPPLDCLYGALYRVSAHPFWPRQ